MEFRLFLIVVLLRRVANGLLMNASGLDATSELKRSAVGAAFVDQIFDEYSTRAPVESVRNMTRFSYCIVNQKC